MRPRSLHTPARACYHGPVTSRPPTVAIITFGCKVNQCDSEAMAAELARQGYLVTPRGAAADAHLVNTCAVTATAEAKARKLIRRLARDRPGAPVVVTGCWAQRDPETVAALPGVAAVLPNTGKRSVAGVVSQLVAPGPRPAQDPPRFRTRAFLKVQDGCDHRCAYCAVPSARGHPTSRPMAEVLAEVSSLAEWGVQEVVLCGIRLGAYGRDCAGPTLARLLRELRGARIPRLRLSSLEPMDVGDDLVTELADHPTLCHHLHLPLQSGDDTVLAAMGRGYGAPEFTALVGRLRQAWPDLALSVDVMVGFPGETEEQFGRTFDFVARLGCSRLHVFPYSPRPGTPAAARPGQVPPAVKRERCARLLALGERLASQAAASWVGRQVEVLFERLRSGGLLFGLTEHYFGLTSPGPEAWVGRIVPVVAEEARGPELVGAARREEARCPSTK